MSDPATSENRLIELAEAVCNKIASEADLSELDSILVTDESSHRRYLEYCRIHVALRMELRAHRAAYKLRQQIDVLSRAPAAGGINVAIVETSPAMPLGAIGNALHGTAGYFSSGWPVAYLAATVILGIGLVISAFTHVSWPEQIVRQHLPSPFGRGAGGEGGRTADTAQSLVVGQITGMVDCRFAEGSKTEHRRPKTTVSSDDKFVLASGLMEITYDSGAKVVLQGPVTYTVESANAGFLSVGRLTARVEKKVASGQWPVASKSEISNPQSPIPNPSLATGHWPLFTITTPTATVTDLGTEFGVEVDKRGVTTSHVFRGSVRVQMCSGGGKAEGSGQVLHENESARVDGGGNQRRIVLVPAFPSSRFVRGLPRRTIKVFDLVDVVAGGDGFSGRRCGGIDPSSGRAVNRPPREWMLGDGRYHRVETMPFVDGVFIPDGRTGPVQVDSAGHTFDGFPNTENRAPGYIWAGGAVLSLAEQPSPTGAWWGGGIGRTELDGIDYGSPGHGVIDMHANKGITFDLEAIRRAHPGCRLLRFRAVAGNSHLDQTGGGGRESADIWVLVDGRVRFQRRDIDLSQGAFQVSVPIGAKDRFLTLAATDAGNGIGADWTMFGDPHLELLPGDAAAGVLAPRKGVD